MKDTKTILKQVQHDESILLPRNDRLVVKRVAIIDAFFYVWFIYKEGKNLIKRE